MLSEQCTAVQTWLQAMIISRAWALLTFCQTAMRRPGPAGMQHWVTWRVWPLTTLLLYCYVVQSVLARVRLHCVIYRVFSVLWFRRVELCLEFVKWVVMSTLSRWSSSSFHGIATPKVCQRFAIVPLCVCQCFAVADCCTMHALLTLLLFGFLKR